MLTAAGGSVPSPWGSSGRNNTGAIEKPKERAALQSVWQSLVPFPGLRGQGLGLFITHQRPVNHIPIKRRHFLANKTVLGAKGQGSLFFFFFFPARFTQSKQSGEGL